MLVSAKEGSQERKGGRLTTERKPLSAGVKGKVEGDFCLGKSLADYRDSLHFILAIVST